MDPHNVFRKTDEGQQEVDRRSGALSMLERRVLILTNGERTIAQLEKLSRIADFSQAMAKLTRLGFVECTIARATTDTTTAVIDTGRAPEPAPPVPSAAPSPVPIMGSINTEARDFMVNMLLTFTHGARVETLMNTIREARTDGELKQLVNDWYAALADSPSGVSEADSLKARLMGMLLLGTHRMTS